MILKLIKIAQDKRNTKPIFVRLAKVMEEVGEFAEAIAYNQGFLPHKKLKEPVEGEAADVIITVIDTLVAAYPKLSEYQLCEMLLQQLDLKSDKWKNIIEGSYENIQ